MTTSLIIFLVICLVLACTFEFVNGFHDTANAVATVIYTNSMKPTVAVVYSGILNFIGVLTGGIAVAMGIVNLLPMEVLVDSNVYHGIAMILALLLSAIIWNLGTWYFGLPASSSHTLIGSIIGIGLAFYFLPDNVGGSAVNWDKAKDTGMALLISPLAGFSVAIIMMFIFKRLVKNDIIYKEPIPGKTPPIWIRMLLWTTCGLVSFFHGQNDGQKGVGLVMMILIAILPASFSLDSDINLQSTNANVLVINKIISNTDTTQFGKEEFKNYNEYEMLDLKNSILLDKYILDVTKSKVNIYFEIDSLKEDNLENVYLNIDENGCLLLIVRKINGKNYHLFVKKLSHEVKDYKISIKHNKLKISLTKKDDSDTWDKLEDNKDKIFQPGPNETLISVNKLKYLYETGTDDEKKRIREKFGENIEERLKSLK